MAQAVARDAHWGWYVCSSCRTVGGCPESLRIQLFVMEAVGAEQVARAD